MHVEFEFEKLGMLHLVGVTQCPATEKEKSEMANIPYASAIGSIMYAILSTRPDVALSLSLTSRFQSNPGVPHWSTVKCIQKYLHYKRKDFL
jgi:hypothetical protein